MIIFVVYATVGAFRSTLDLLLVIYTWHIHEALNRISNEKVGCCARFCNICMRLLAVIMFIIGYLCMRWLDPHVLNSAAIIFKLTPNEHDQERLRLLW